ncbi:transporter substrate-binding domain-containing protein [Pseudomonas gessardii]|uniref:Transporter substrate-binding domain-containing protein n=1 Tax=Pseudomonas gessardii TaxID=78544 RepID=A0ABS9F2N5_9PSED|nr:transporter substrate-binding domain-containing protein [Pseudomonas gessardii]MCF4977215.1 transporter substrate-binding domain-containing protein [Pseudomonas gessardii]MCF4988168.1 transporter substrate-binding domain-containing protein [Pseudomonas gessardii]MCF5084385.1 transporter substrate-binding domain-containing protein [Pseudomonas gessardii]MCF5093560.1 transporter substrate-binding domain-containing protein [Pseudomonas gessardii]MCF5105530.1 transporter substrate-binding domai
MAWAKIFVLSIGSLLSGSFLVGAAAGAAPRSEIRFAISPLFPPYESRNAQGQLVGLNIELGNALCAQLDVRCTWVDQVFTHSIGALESRRFDAIMGMASTPQRRQLIDFSDDLYPLTTHLVARRYSGLMPTVRALKGKRVGVLTGSNREAFALAQWAPAGVIIKSFWLNDQLIRSLVAGDIDATLQGTAEIRQELLDTEQGQSFDFVGPPVTGQQLGTAVAIGVRKSDPELRRDLNRALEQLKQSGEHQRILQSYQQEEPEAATVQDTHGPQFYPSEVELPFSEAVRVGSMLYISTILGVDANRNLVKGGTGAQMTQVMTTLHDLLERHQSSLDRVVKCTLMLVDLDDLALVNQVYLGYFARSRLPARSVLAIRRLPHGARVAMECVALTEEPLGPAMRRGVGN